MEFHELARNRYSCRKYTDRKPDRELIERVMQTVRVAPSAKNLQPWKFIVVEDSDTLTAVKGTYGRSWINEAPLVIAACGDHGSGWQRQDGKDHTDIDVAIAIDHLTLAATSHGLGTCWVCKFDAARAAEILDLPGEWEVIALVPIGFPADQPDTERHERLRKPLEQIVSYNTF